MAKTADEGNKKRPRPIRSEGGRKHPQDIPQSSVQDTSSQFRGKESPLAKKVRTDEQYVSNKTLETGEAQQAKLSLPDSAMPKRKPKDSPDLKILRSYVEAMGGSIEDGWHVKSYKSLGSGKLVKTFVSPSNEKFRSRVEVAKHLGLSLSLPKKGESNSGNELAQPQMDHDKDEHQNTVVDGHVKFTPPTKAGAKSNHGEHGQAIRQKEHSSDEHGSEEETAADVNNGIAMASKVLKGGLGVQKTFTGSDVTERCQDALRSIISTENFAALSNILNRGSPSGSLDSSIQLNVLPGTIDLQLIHLRLSNGVYGLDPELFCTDIKQVWKNISAVGNELVALAQSLLDFSDKLYKQQIRSLFDVSASKDVSEEEEKEFAGCQHGKQSNADSLVSLNPQEKPEILQTISTDVCEEKLPTQTYKSKQMAKKAAKSKKPLIFKEEFAHKSILETCKGCGLKHGNDSIVCKLCKSGFHIHCTGSLSNELQEGEWCCSTCAENEDKNTQVLAEIVETCKQLAKTTGKSGVCEECKKEDDNVLRCDECDAAYHMTCVVPVIERVPDELWVCPKCSESQKSSGNGIFEIASVTDDPVCGQIPEAPSPLKTEHDAKQKGEKHRSLNSGVKSPDESVDCITPKDVDHPGSPVATLEDEPLPEPHFLIGNENACKACGVEGAKSMLSCSFCTTRYHLSCLKPALKRAPRSTWYCPSCLCRVCKVDADDDRILLCDTCDEGYHTYCLKPPLDEKPKGAWYCPSCIKPEEVPNPPSPKQTEVAKRKRKSTEPRRST